MTFDPNIPNAGQSPALFPPQNATNYTRLKAIINADHVFNDTAADNDGIHRRVTLVNQANPVSVPTGANSIVYGKTAADTVNELWFYDNVSARQLNWREIQGTVNITGTTITAISNIPASCYGYIYLFKDLMMQYGTFVSNTSTVNGQSYIEKYQDGSSPREVLELLSGTNASAFSLRVRRNTDASPVNSVSTAGVWTYRIFFRKI